MKTRDPDRARILARRLASRWDMEMTMLEYSVATPMTASQRSQILKIAMVEELTLATAHALDRSTFDDAEEKRRARIFAAARGDVTAALMDDNFIASLRLSNSQGASSFAKPTR